MMSFSIIAAVVASFFVAWRFGSWLQAIDQNQTNAQGGDE